MKFAHWGPIPSAAIDDPPMKAAMIRSIQEEAETRAREVYPGSHLGPAVVKLTDQVGPPMALPDDRPLWRKVADLLQGKHYEPIVHDMRGSLIVLIEIEVTP